MRCFRIIECEEGEYRVSSLIARLDKSLIAYDEISSKYRAVKYPSLSLFSELNSPPYSRSDLQRWFFKKLWIYISCLWKLRINVFDLVVQITEIDHVLKVFFLVFNSFEISVSFHQTFKQYGLRKKRFMVHIVKPMSSSWTFPRHLLQHGACFSNQSYLFI